MDDFHSSEDEVEPHRSEFAHAGQLSIDKMLNNCLQDRVTSLRASKSLGDVSGRPQTQYARALWSNRLKIFRAETLRKDIRLPPTGNEIERFITSIIGYIKPQSSHGVVSYTTIKTGLLSLTTALVFEYEKFALSPHETLHIKTMVDKLLAEGKLTKEPRRIKQWVGVNIIRLMAAATFEDALNHGTLNWDVTISKITSIVLLSALQCRVGDIAKDRLDRHALPFLCYGDLTIKLTGGRSTIDGLTAKVLIRNEKGYKLDPKRNRIVTLTSVQDLADVLVCPIRLVLILALRTGAVASTSVDDLLADTFRRRDKTVQWVDGKRPVLAMLAHIGTSLLLDKPASNVQMLSTFAKAGLLSGITESLTTHDSRRGSASDCAMLKDNNRTDIGISTPAVAASVGHSSAALSRGTTAQYVGDTKRDLWSKRLLDIEEDDFDLKATAPAYKKQFVGPHEITARCVDKGADANAKENRWRVAAEIHKEHLAAWKDDVKKSPYLGESQGALRPWTPSEMNKRSNALQTDDPGDPTEEIPIDPQLLADANQICDLVRTEGSENASHEVQMFLLQTQKLDWVNSDSPTAFVDHFARINIVRNRTFVQDPAQRQYAFENILHGHGKDAPTQFQFLCPQTALGCAYSSPNDVLMRLHTVNCPLKNVTRPKPYRCLEPGCNSSFEKSTGLSSHKATLHKSWEPRACTIGGPRCDVTKVFTVKGSCYSHRSKVHVTKYQATTCQYVGCQHTTKFASSESYRNHLKSVHRVGRDQMRSYIDGIVGHHYTADKCPVPNCKSDVIHSTVARLRKHLKSGLHDLTEEEIEAYANTRLS